MKKSLPQHLIDKLWDLWCLTSIVGIWPRYIEPKLITTTKSTLAIKNLPKELENLKVLQFSDLHFSSQTSNNFLSRLKRKIASLKPDLILFTGDMICYAQMENEKKLESFLASLHAPLGLFCIPGNHDYSAYVTKNREGKYAVMKGGDHFIVKAFEKIFLNPKKHQSSTNDQLHEIAFHKQLEDVFKKTNFHLLENACIQIEKSGAKLNICGLGDYWLSKCDPARAFRGYDKRFPGIILSHNPDTIDLLKDYPGDIVLSGHTHGGQVNLPLIWKHFIGIDNLNFKRGLHRIGNKYLYINRGIGSHHPFRWFSTPEILLLTLTGEK